MNDYKEVFRRTEIKYLINEKQYKEIMRYLNGIAAVDEYGLSRINNIYFDTNDHRLIRTSMEKPVYKEKLRLRTYGVTNDESNSFIEIKKKYDGVVYKRRISAGYTEALDYLTDKRGRIDDSQISKEIESFKQTYKDLKPAMKICYDRIAMAGKDDKEFRVTFDTDITWDTENIDLREYTPGYNILKAGQYLMEIKVSNSFSTQLAKMLSKYHIFPVSFSKYAKAYLDMLSMKNDRPEQIEAAERLIRADGSSAPSFSKGERIYA
ncbi:MAG: polyphosphate polymerase domain-containing protein [Lachnospiraceae bacterium]|nr:polyphosphate polymerase domain-containing protein [Lachnospiraceae bacterium]